SEELSLDLQDQYWRSLLLGCCNSAALLIFMGVFAQRIPALSGLCFVVAATLVILGLHGIIRSTGEWVYERCFGKVPNPGWALALGCFVCLYVACIPVIGWLIALFWSVRGLGGVILQIASNKSQS